MSKVGTEWLIDAGGCEAEALCDVVRLQTLFDCVVAELRLQPLGPSQWHQFPSPGGITGVLLLRESHLTCHTYPEVQTITLNLYCCQSRPEWRWAEVLVEVLGAQTVWVREYARGLLPTPTAT
jgi:S-adenosylmethionine decarboxylase